ncbi:MAG: TerC family protein [Tatlockia sp.]|jgi:predicted tellurium resistance membrane protein TerC
MDFINLLASLLALIVLEIVLGIDNLVFLTILTEKLPKTEQKKARQWGLTFAWVTRLLLLASAVWLSQLTRPLLQFHGFSFSCRDLFLFLGGLFLLTKATQEIHNEMGEDREDSAQSKGRKVSLRGVVVQVALMDIVFSFDSVLTAIGLTNQFWVMAAAITCAILVMIFASEPVSRFINKHPTIKMLALSFLILVGTFLVADSFSLHVPRGYIYFAMAFSLGVEMLNIVKRAPSKSQKKQNKPE